ncbi:MAG: gamma-glutamyltransferase, partial [Flavobacteriaceae bacterium]|nr:gamma-glutamyltransferase [Flavobacteriaceae bacterium]
MRLFLILFSIICLSACKQNNPTPEITIAEPVNGLITENAMIVSATKEASKIGSDILAKGGNAFDAMVATEMALAVTYPYAGNLGGGGFMVYRTQYKEIGALDFREKAPLAATRDMYLDENGEAISEKSSIGGLAVGVPGTIAGIFAVHEKFGSLPMNEILEPVIELARNGYAVTEKKSDRLKKYKEIIEKVNQESSLYTENFALGDTIKNIALANTLQRIAANGRSEFYQGETAEKLVDFMKSKEGIITLEDL